MKEWKKVWKEAKEYFDFEEVHRMMTLTGWTWYNFETSLYGIPTLKMIKKNVKDKIKRLFKYNLDYIISGGFEVYKDKLDGDNVIKIKFVYDEATILMDD